MKKPIVSRVTRSAEVFTQSSWLLGFYARLKPSGECWSQNDWRSERVSNRWYSLGRWADDRAPYGNVIYMQPSNGIAETFDRNRLKYKHYL